MRRYLFMLTLSVLALAQGPFRPPGTRPTVPSAGNPGLNVTFVWDETPVQSTTLVYGLAHTPNPSASLRIYVSGAHLRQNVDFALSGSTVTFTGAYSALLATGNFQMIAEYQY